MQPASYSVEIAYSCKSHLVLKYNLNILCSGSKFAVYSSQNRVCELGINIILLQFFVSAVSVPLKFFKIKYSHNNVPGCYSKKAFELL